MSRANPFPDKLAIDTLLSDDQEPVVLQANNLAFSYPGQERLFESVSLVVKAREIVCLLGASGCGKSSLLRVMAGLALPDQGDIHFLQTPLRSPHPNAALLFQSPSLLPWLNVRHNVGFGLDFKHQPDLTSDELATRVQTALEAVGLGDHAQQFPFELSGGMAQRVALARALAREPRLLLADEPFSALDAITRAHMQTLLIALANRWSAAVLMVTHDIDEAILVADRVVLLGKKSPNASARLIREWSVTIDRSRSAYPTQVSSLRLQILQALQTHHLSL